MGRVMTAAVLGAVLSVSFLACTVAQASPAGADRALDAALARLVHARGGPLGAIAIVQRGAQTRSHAAGRARLGGRGPSAGDAMRLASTTKAFNGAVALALVSRRVLSLNDTIGQRLRYLPAAWADVTLREALNHTSGLPSFTDSHSYLAALEASPAHGPPPRQLVAFVEKKPLLFRPGTKYRYSNTDNVIAGLMAEQATGRSYEYELRRLVLRPLRLRRTALPRTVAMSRPLLHGYQFTSSGRREDISTAINPAWTWAAGGMVSTPAELNRFARAYASGRLFSRKVHRAQFVAVAGDSEPPGPGVNSAGLGIFRYRTRCGTVYGHTGNFPGYTQFFASSSSGQRSVTVSVNQQLRPDNAPRIFSLLLKADTLGVCAALAR